MPVAVQQPDRVVLLEVLPLEHGVREDLEDPFDEGLDEAVVRRSPQAWLSVPEVAGSFSSASLSVPTSSETGRVRARWMPAPAVYSASLPTRMPMPPLVAEAEDPLVVRRDDETNVLVPGVRQKLGDPIDVLGCEPQSRAASA